MWWKKRTTMSTATKTTFEVSNVKRATAPLPEVSYKEAVEALLTPGKPLDLNAIPLKSRRTAAV